MRKKLKWMLLLVGTLMLGSVQATPASGFKGQTIASGQFDDLDLRNHMFLPEGFRPESEGFLWLLHLKTKGASDLYVQDNSWDLGGTTGWHTHPGPSLIIVIAGTITAYEGDDPSCTPHVYKAGMTFVDPGGGHVHILRNEGSEVARTIAVQLIPHKAARRIDVAAGPPTCPF
jgi:quercetin dioxygenase-like cupin family protein